MAMNQTICPDEAVEPKSKTEEPRDPVGELEPFHFRTKEEMLKREEEIREASLAAYKEECKRVRNKKDSIERRRFENTPYYLDY